MANHKIAVILAGAVAKGAFEAGALEVLAQQLPANVEIARIVGASSGALNATMLASGVSAGTLAASTKALAELWRNEGGVLHTLHPNLRDALSGRGFSDQRGLRSLLVEHVAPQASKHAVDLRIVVAPLSGNPTVRQTSAGTTYEAILAFSERDFTTRAGLDKVFDAAVASSAFPVLFAPFDPGQPIGPSIDGGIVNNTPIKYAVEDGAVDTVVLVLPTVGTVKPDAFNDVSGIDLIGHVADMLINERLYRDLVDADDINQGLANLDKLVSTGKLSAAQLDDVKNAIDWAKYKPIRVLTIRPDEPLPGNSFSGFLKESLRSQYLDLGRKKATDVLSGIVWT